MKITATSNATQTVKKNRCNQNCIVFAILIVIAITAMGFGCNSSKPMPDPLAGFHWSSLVNLDNNKVITDDYKSYIQTLSPEERKFATVDEFLEDGKGESAVSITVGLNDTNWRHVLIYDKNNKRIKTIKYVSGHSMS
ncbi:MAG TPA: hypothetical protein VGN23_11720 [Verrucomicrobiae bacterium]|jgi:hypothetical protein